MLQPAIDHGVQVKRFDHEGLHQLQNISFVTDEDPRGRNVLLELSFLAT